MSRQSLSPTLLHRAVQPPHAVAAMVMVVVSCLLEGVTTQAHYYTVSRGSEIVTAESWLPRSIRFIYLNQDYLYDVGSFTLL